MLDSLTRDTLDPGYERAARRRQAGIGSSKVAGRTWLIAGTVVVGLLLGVALQNTNANSAGVDQARDALNLDVANAQDREAELAASVSGLAAQVRSAQSGAADTGPLATLNVLEEMNALVAVTGPGLRVILNDPGAATGDSAILDRDIQLLVNGLWSSGAEAIAVGGVRLRVTSAIRQAGGAILVDNRPVAWPMTIEAIGDPRNIQQKFISTAGYGRFNSFVQLYGVGFDVTAAESLSLPAAAAVDNRYIETSPSATEPLTTEPTTQPPTTPAAPTS